MDGNVRTTFDLDTFKKAQAEMIAKNDQAWESGYVTLRSPRCRDYTLEEIQQIIDKGSLIEQQKLSRNYFDKDGLYKRIILYYATILTYSGY